MKYRRLAGGHGESSIPPSLRSPAWHLNCAQAVATLGESAIAVRTDVTDTADVEALIGTAIERHGRIDILIANAGVYTGGDFADADPAEPRPDRHQRFVSGHLIAGTDCVEAGRLDS